MTSDPNLRPSIIIGGGISGLSAAYYLSKRGLRSLLIDPAESLGGVIQTKTIANCLVEGGPDSFLSAKPEAMNLIKELGLEGEVIGSNDHQRSTWVWKNGRMIALPDGLMMVVPTRVMPMALSPLLSWGTKIRMGLELFRKPGPRRPDRSVGEFVEDHYGKEAVDYLAEPLLSGVYGGDPYHLSVESVLPRFAEMESKFGSLTKGTLAGMAHMPHHLPGAKKPTLFRTLKGGLATLVDAIAKAASSHMEVWRGSVSDVEKIEGGYRVHVNGKTFETSHLVIATPAWSAAKLVEGFDAELGASLASIGYSNSLTAALIYDRAQVGRKFPSFGFLVPKIERQLLVACTFVDQKFDHRVPADRLFLRCFVGGDKPLSMTDAEVQAGVEKDLERLIGLKAQPIAVEITRWPRSMAQYPVGHSANLARIDSRVAQHEHLYLAGNGYRGIGIPDCIRSGKDAAERIGL